MYLLKNPDHYTNFDSAPVFWKSFVNEARKPFNKEENDRSDDKVTLIKRHGRIIGLSPIYDYIFRPSELQDLTLYDWVRLCKRKKVNKSNSKSIVTDDIVQPAEQCELTDSEEASDLSMTDSDSDDENTEVTNIASKVSATPEKNQPYPQILCVLHETHKEGVL